jgi:hypothetical protein
VLEYWSDGVLGLKAEKDLILTLLPLIMQDPNMVYIFPFYQPFITRSVHHSITPVLQVRPITSFDKERRTAVYHRR